MCFRSKLLSHPDWNNERFPPIVAPAPEDVQFIHGRSVPANQSKEKPRRSGAVLRKSPDHSLTGTNGGHGQSFPSMKKPRTRRGQSYPYTEIGHRRRGKASHGHATAVFQPRLRPSAPEASRNDAARPQLRYRCSMMANPRSTNPSIPKDRDMIDIAAPRSILLVPEAVKGLPQTFVPTLFLLTPGHSGPPVLCLHPVYDRAVDVGQMETANDR
jgi:hypothetical protein